MDIKSHFIALCFLFLLFAPVGFAQELEWTEIENGIWKASVGEPEDISLLKAADVQPRTEALDKLPTAVFPLSKDWAAPSRRQGPIRGNKTKSIKF